MCDTLSARGQLVRTKSTVKQELIPLQGSMITSVLPRRPLHVNRTTGIVRQR